MTFNEGTWFLAPDHDASSGPLYLPGAPAPHSGIYRCRSCQRAIASNAGEALPGDDHHPHSITQGAIRWQLQVRLP